MNLLETLALQNDKFWEMDVKWILQLVIVILGIITLINSC